MQSEDPETADFRAIQLVQNNLLRTLNGTLIKDKVSISFMLNKFNMLSTNQLNASVKVLEVWKALNVEDYPLQIARQENHLESINTRAALNRRPIQIGKTILTQKTCISDAIHLWNRSPCQVTESKTLYQAKRVIRDFVTTLPI